MSMTRYLSRGKVGAGCHGVVLLGCLEVGMNGIGDIIAHTEAGSTLALGQNTKKVGGKLI